MPHQLNRFVLLACFAFMALHTQAQFLDFAKPRMDTLCSARFAGRGYVNDGVNIAAEYIAQQLEKLDVQPQGTSYFQRYSFPINTIPGGIYCKLDGTSFNAGEHFLVSSSSKSCNGKFKLYPFRMNNATDCALLLKKLEAGLGATEAIVFRDIDDMRKFRKYQDSLADLGYAFPVSIIATKTKLLWTPSTELENNVELTFPDSIISNKDELEINFENKFIKDFPCKNIIGYVPAKFKKRKGAESNKCIVFSSHYDHLGMLGNKAFFPGASDNASGVSMLLSLAKYFGEHKQDVPIYFIFFSGEETGLLGSKYFVEHPTFPLNNIKALINIDIMGSADQGITVVNGETYKDIYNKLVDINKQNNYLPEVKIRGKAANSDHYFFSESGVPSIFIYSNGGPGFYHDVWDTPSSLTLKNFDNVAKLLVDYIEQIK
jgi:aminopeptidase YwaD